MNAADLAAQLDDYFHLDRFPTDDFAILPDFCRKAGIRIEEYATPAFLQRFNGLMLDNTGEVDRVFTLVFPSDEVLAEVERRAAGEATLIFTHHPMDMETSGRGLIPIGVERLRRLCEARISLYAVHAPLDCHETVSTSRALARAVGVPAEATFAGYFGGHAGVRGHIDPVSLQEFSERVRRACGIDRIEMKTNGDSVQHVGVVAGGAAYPPLMQEALDAGCDTYLTGDFRIRHGGPWAEEHRPGFDSFVEDVPLNLIGASHYATESLVLREEMLSFFRDLAQTGARRGGLAAEFVPQSDPWR